MPFIHTYFIDLTSIFQLSLFVSSIFKYLNCPISKQIEINLNNSKKEGKDQVPHLTQDTKWKVTNSQLDITNESQEVSSFPAYDHKATIN